MDDLPPDSGSGGQSGNRFFPRIKSFIDGYSKGSGDDQRAARLFIDCEAAEALTSLRSELLAVSKGKYHPRSLDQIVGKDKLARYGSYDRWAGLTLKWMAEYRRG